MLGGTGCSANRLPRDGRLTVFRINDRGWADSDDGHHGGVIDVTVVRGSVQSGGPTFVVTAIACFSSLAELTPDLHIADHVAPAEHTHELSVLNHG